MRKALFAFFLAPLLMGGCLSWFDDDAEETDKKDAWYYTAYNVFYRDPDAVSPRNYLSGDILPFGTKVRSAPTEDEDDDEVILETVAEGRRFCFLFHKDLTRKEKMDFLAQLLDSPRRFRERTAAFSPEQLEPLRRGEVRKGMTREETLLAYGPPPPDRTPNLEYHAWVYCVTAEKSRRIFFKNDKIVYITDSR